MSTTGTSVPGRSTAKQDGPTIRMMALIGVTGVAVAAAASNQLKQLQPVSVVIVVIILGNVPFSFSFSSWFLYNTPASRRQ